MSSVVFGQANSGATLPVKRVVLFGKEIERLAGEVEKTQAELDRMVETLTFDVKL